MRGTERTKLQSIRPVANRKRNNERREHALDRAPTRPFLSVVLNQASMSARVMAFKSPGAALPNRNVRKLRSLP